MLGAGGYTKGTDGMLLGWIGIFQSSVTFEYTYSPLQFMISVRIILAVIMIVWMVVSLLLGADMKVCAFEALPWGICLVLGTMMTVAGALSSLDLGLRDWLVQILSPIFGTTSYFLFCCMILFFTVFITNLMSNQATIMIMLSIAATFMDKFAFMLYCSGPNSPYFLDRPEMKKDQKFIFTYGPLFLLIAVAVGAAESPGVISRVLLLFRHIVV